MPSIAATLTTLERIAQVPASTWWILGAIIAAVFLIGPFFRKIREISGIWITLILFCGSILVGAHWVYHRTEPAFLTPLVDVVAHFLPKKPANGR